MRKEQRPGTTIDLKRLAKDAMVQYGFEPAFSPACQQQVATLENQQDDAKAQEARRNGAAGLPVRDMRNLLWSSIDNIESQDLDQIEYTERLPSGDIRLLVGIADVDVDVPKDSPIDEHAYQNCFSIYTGIMTFPMLPLPLSEGMTSLLEGEERRCIVTETVIGSDGEIKSSDVYAALVINKAKLAYEPVADWLDGKGELPKLAQVPGLEEQLRMQDELATRLYDLHHRSGELTLQTIEPQPIMHEGTVLDMQVREQNRAREIIKNMMVTSNIALAEYLRARKSPVVERVVRRPKKWDRLISLASTYGFTLPAEPDAFALNQFVAERKNKDPDRFPDLSLTVVKLLGPGEYMVQLPTEESVGHFGLAVHEYTHSTAPNRRYPDLVTQRMVKAILSNAPAPYTADDLRAICEHIIERENAARKLERFTRKAAAAVLLSSHIGQVYDGICTGASQSGTYVRIFSPPAEGRVVDNDQGLDVGDKCKVKLVGTDPLHGFIDFERVN